MSAFEHVLHGHGVAVPAWHMVCMTRMGMLSPEPGSFYGMCSLDSHRAAYVMML